MVRPCLPCGSAAALLFLSACGGVVDARASNEVEPRDVESAVRATKNVVVFLVDTLRADHLGCYGYSRATSPHLDGMAAEGIVFEDCLAQSSWTKPTTASVLTGEVPARHGVTHPEASVSTEVSTLAELVSAQGIATGAVIGNEWISESMGFARGFDTFVIPKNKRCGTLVDAGLDWIRQRGEEPFFLYVHTVDPHAPYSPPEPFDRLFDPDYEGPVTGREKAGALRSLRGADLDHLIALYDGEIAYVDQELGRFLGELAAMGRDADTAVLFLADHGEAFHDHGDWGHNPMLFQEVVRVPLVLRVPGAPSLAGLRHPGLVQQIDVAPTVLSLFRIEPDVSLPGQSLLALLAAPTLRGPEAFAVTEVDWYHNRKAVVSGGMKYVREVAPRPAEYLYDLRGDPGELRNLLPEGRRTADRYAAILDAYQSSTSAGFSVLVQNEEESELAVRVHVASAQAPIRKARIFNGEWRSEDGDGPVELGQVELGGVAYHVASVPLTVRRGDSDGIVFEPPEEGEVFLAVEAGGRWVPAERFLLGPSIQASEMPIRLRADADAFDAPRFPATEDLGGDPYRIRVWRNLAARTDDGEISAETRAALQAMGYLGDAD